MEDFLPKVRGVLFEVYLPWALSPTWASRAAQTVQNPPAMHNIRVWSLGQEEPLRREWQPTPVFLPIEFHEQKGWVGYSPWSHKELDMTEWLLGHRQNGKIKMKSNQHLLSTCSIQSPMQPYKRGLLGFNTCLLRAYCNQWKELLHFISSKNLKNTVHANNSGIRGTLPPLQKYHVPLNSAPSILEVPPYLRFCICRFNQPGTLQCYIHTYYQ